MHLHNFLKSLKELLQTSLRHYLELSSPTHFSFFFSGDKCQQVLESQREIICHTKYRFKGYFRFQLIQCLFAVFLLHGPITKKKLLLTLQTEGKGKVEAKSSRSENFFISYTWQELLCGNSRLNMTMEAQGKDNQKLHN